MVLVHPSWNQVIPVEFPVEYFHLGTGHVDAMQKSASAQKWLRIIPGLSLQERGNGRLEVAGFWGNCPTPVPTRSEVGKRKWHKKKHTVSCQNQINYEPRFRWHLHALFEAFDMINHNIMFTKLKAYGITGPRTNLSEN